MCHRSQSRYDGASSAKFYCSLGAALKVNPLKVQNSKASLRINQAMLEFYWEMGHDSETLQKSHSWGSGFFERLSLDLRSEFPGRDGFSVTNLRYMKNWYLFYNQCFTNRYQLGNDLDNNSMPEILAYIPWRHHIDILREYQGMLQSLT